MEFNHKVQLNHSTVQHENFEKDNKTKWRVDFGFEATTRENIDCSLILVPTAQKVDVKF